MAIKPVYSSIISSRAQKEILNSWNWYEDRQPGLGDRFVKEVFNTIQLIEQYPESYPSKYKAYREKGIDTFPFLIIYRINKRKRVVRVISVFHTSRNPKKKY